MERIAPMLATPSTSASGRPAVKIETLEGTHTFDLKLDGLRAMAYWDGKALTLINRNGVNITAQFPEIAGVDLGYHHDKLIFDGEIVATDGRFQTVATRGKQTRSALIEKAAESAPCKFVAFDLLLDMVNTGFPGSLSEPYLIRRARLNNLNLPAPFGLSVISPTADLLTHVASLGMEGVIAKRNDSRYIPGGRTRDWIKFKVLHSITAIAIGYEPGTGSRAHFGAMQLAVLDGDKIVPLGRVGTGFTEAEILDLKARLDAGRPTLVEIECLNRTADGALRFPVYKGIRTDLSVLDASVTQLATLPLC